MLFDLRGKGRRRTVQVIYLSLAILMGGGLVLFGIGGATSGGLFDAFSSDSGTQNVSSTYTKQVKANQAKVTANPKDVAAWAALTRAQVQQAGVSGYDQATGTYTADGLKQLQAAADSWQKYLDLDPKKPDGNLASLMVNTYGRQRAQRPRPLRRGARDRHRRTRRQLRALHAARGPLLHRRKRPQERPRRAQRRLPRRSRAAQARQGPHRRAAQADRQGQAPGRRPAERRRRGPRRRLSPGRAERLPSHVRAADPVSRAGPPL